MTEHYDEYCNPQRRKTDREHGVQVHNTFQSGSVVILCGMKELEQLLDRNIIGPGDNARSDNQTE